MRLSRPLLLAAIAIGSAFAQRVGAPTDDLEKLNVDELFSVQVTSVGRKAQQLSSAPAAVFVLTADDIRRSGASSIPEALRWVPGLSVLGSDGRSWAISARGSNRLFANKMLVMIDGRSLYTPLFSGVIWDAIDLPLEDIEQIEIVRGPGAVMWGPNAVNGVINIITKHAKATKGALVSVATGNEAPGSATARWGRNYGDNLAFRVWGKAEILRPAYSSPEYYYYFGPVFRDSGLVDNLNSASGHAGFRLEGQPSEKDQWMLQGDMSKLGRHEMISNPMLGPDGGGPAHSGYAGGYVQGRWVHSSSKTSEGVLQLSYDRSNIDYPFEGGDVTNLVVDYQRRVQTGERNEFYSGVGFQQYRDVSTMTPLLRFEPADGLYRAGDVVIRDEWQIVPGRLTGSAGVRLDYNSYHSLEYQPSIRLLYTPNVRSSAWVAASRAVKVPDRLDRALNFSRMVEDPALPMPVEVQLRGNEHTVSEVERSLEAGYRRQAGQHWSFDVSVFRSLYSRLRARDTTPTPIWTGTGLVMVMNLDNGGAARTYGGEISGTWQVSRRWRVLPSYSYLRDCERLPNPLYSWERPPSDLRQQGTLRSQHDISRNVQLDLMARGRSRDLAYSLPGALFMDARVGWRPVSSGELSLLVANIADRHVIEIYPEIGFRAIPTRRTFSLKWTQRF